MSRRRCTPITGRVRGRARAWLLPWACGGWLLLTAGAAAAATDAAVVDAADAGAMADAGVRRGDGSPARVKVIGYGDRGSNCVCNAPGSAPERGSSLAWAALTLGTSLWWRRWR
ncbi:MAG: hypothetical protein OEZ06_26185 [Myxococcales bacterium]|nr:hypothetical protein [Myxococcales bacterium]